MQSDDMIWNIIYGKANFCSYRTVLKNTKPRHKFCRNEYNVTGICTRKDCPLANGQYATIREIDGKIYLYKKSVERAHLPSQLWEVVALEPNFVKALDQIEANLQYWPKKVKNKCKRRLTKIVQYLIRMKRLKNKPNQKVMVPINKKIERRERNKEERALNIAFIEKKIKTELLDRLKQGVYGDIYNFNQKAFEEIMEEEEKEMEPEFVEEESQEEMEDLDTNFGSGFSDEEIDKNFGGSSDEDEGDEDEGEEDNSEANEGEPENANIQTDDQQVEVENEEQQEKVPINETKKPSRKRKTPPNTKATRETKKQKHLEIEYDEPEKQKEVLEY